MVSKDEYKEKVRSELFKMLGRSSFGKDVIEQRFTGVHFARGLMSIDEAVESVILLSPKEKEEVYKLGKKLAKLDSEMAFHYFKSASEAIKHFNFEDMQKWVDKGITFYESYGVVPARNFFKGITRETIEEIHSVGLDLDKIHRILSIYVDALSGGRLTIEGSEETYTDTRKVFLQNNIAELPDNEGNFKLYKIATTHKYGQIRYRSFDLNPKKMSKLFDALVMKYNKNLVENVSPIENFFNLFPDRQLALDIFNIVENYRVQTCLRREFRGLSRDLDFVSDIFLSKRPEFSVLNEKEALLEALLQHLFFGEVKKRLPKALEETYKKCYNLVQKMLKSRATAEGSAETTAKIYALLEGMESQYNGTQEIFTIGTIKPERITIALKETEKELIEKTRKLFEELEVEPPQDIESKVIEARNEVLDPFAIGSALEFIEKLKLHIPDELWEKLRKEIERKLGELGELDASLMTKVLDSAGRMIRAHITAAETKFQVELTEEDVRDAILYDEWDYKMGHYRAKWCALREKPIPKGDNKFVEKTLEKYVGLVNLIRRQFEMLRPEYRKLKKQLDGEEIDIDAFIEAHADIKAGITPSEKLYIKADKRERDIAVAFLVDLSGSTTGWVIETEKEALVLMCEALEILGDRYAIYGFSGKTRKQCDFYMIKDFDEPYDAELRRKIAGMDAFDYTRMGPPIRHLNEILNELPAKVKMMVILSDGKPEDFDEYKGEHGIEDTRKALIESKRKHIKPFCITIDKEARDYISHMYGDVNYIILDDVTKLPRKLPEIYRKLTT